MMTFRIFGLVLSTLALTVFSVAAPARPLDEVTTSNKLKVIAYDDNKPFSWTDDGAIKGIDVDLAKAIAKELGVEADIELRMQGEKVDNDLRVNVIRGTVGGGIVGDIMMHIPIDKELSARFKEVVIGNAYFKETVALAIDPKRVPKDATFELFKSEKIGVKLGTVSDYFLMTYEDGVLVNNISHHVKGPVGAKEFLDGDVAALMGVRSEIEGTFKDIGATAEFINPDMTGIIRRDWVVGIALNERSRDLGYAVGGALEKLEKSGGIKEIFAKYGVTHVSPVGN